MIAKRTLVLGFADASADQSNRYAAELKDSLLAASRDVQVERSRERDDAQDFGGTLVVVLGTTAINTLAHGIAA